MRSMLLLSIIALSTTAVHPIQRFMTRNNNQSVDTSQVRTLKMIRGQIQLLAKRMQKKDIMFNEYLNGFLPAFKQLSTIVPNPEYPEQKKAADNTLSALATKKELPTISDLAVLAKYTNDQLVYSLEQLAENIAKHAGISIDLSPKAPALPPRTTEAVSTPIQLPVETKTNQPAMKNTPRQAGALLEQIRKGTSLKKAEPMIIAPVKSKQQEQLENIMQARNKALEERRKAIAAEEEEEEEGKWD